MSISQGVTTQAKYVALEHLSNGTLKMALYTGNADLNASTLLYTSANEVVGTGYVAGGKVLQNVTLNKSDTVAYLSFDNVTWDPASFTARCALIYNVDLFDLAVAVLDFGSDKTATSKFVVEVPADNASSALIRIS